MKAVILAAGRGTRLQPITNVIPKPLVTLGEYTMLEILLRQLRHAGFKEIIVTTYYLAELLELYLQKYQQQFPDITITPYRMPALLGTVGGLSAVPGLDAPFLLLSCDLLTNIQYRALVTYHEQQQAMLTAAVYRKSYPLHLGMIETDAQNRIVGYREKPILPIQVSMALYVMTPAVLPYIKQDEFQDMPDLIMTLVAAGKPVLSYMPDDIYWLDIGRMEDLT
jgi:NDP-sugar pyrophosphorylase family protein